MFFSSKFDLDAYVVSDIGLESIRNEDYSILAYSINPDIKIMLAIADGVRQNPSGDVASKFVIDKIQQYHINRNSILDSSKKDYKKFLIETVKKINIDIIEISRKILSYFGMASTCAIFSITKNNKLVCLSVGDCGIFICRKKSIKKLCGLYSISDSSKPQEHVFGVKDTIKYDLKIVNVKKDDLIIISSDGAIKNDTFMSEALEIYLENNSAKEICNLLIKKALDKKIKDNITIGVVLVK